MPLRSNLKPFALEIHIDFERFHILAMDLRYRRGPTSNRLDWNLEWISIDLRLLKWI